MAIAFDDLKFLAIQTVQDPGDAARRLLALDLPREIGWMALILSGVVSALLTGLSDVLMPPQPIEMANGEILEPLVLPPLLWGIISEAGTAALTFSLFQIGRMQGGTSDFTAMLNLMAWLQVFMVLVLLAQILLLLFAPMMAIIAVLIGLVVSFRAMAHFVNEAHGFDSIGRSAGVIVLSFIALVVVMAIVLGAAGVGQTGV